MTFILSYVITFVLSSSLYILILYDKYSNHICSIFPTYIPLLLLAFHGIICYKTVLKYSPFLTCYSWLLIHFGFSIGCLVSPNYYQTKTIISISWLNYARLI